MHAKSSILIAAAGMLAASGAMTALTPAAKAADPAFCTQYAATAVAQNRRNRNLGCGFRGPRWHRNWQAHFAWCLTQPYRIANRETRIRRNRLNVCRSGGPPPFPVTRTFFAPKIGGVRLDWCRRWAAECGRPAADAFCRRRGYRRAVSFSFARDIGRWTNTRIISTGQICHGNFCDGFRRITCIR